MSGGCSSCLNVSLTLAAPSNIDRFLIKEELSRGQRVRAFEIHADGVVVYNGTAVGRTLIAKLDKNLSAVKVVTLVVRESVGSPSFRLFAVPNPSVCSAGGGGGGNKCELVHDVVYVGPYLKSLDVADVQACCDACPKCGPAASVAEWRSHFGAWCIASSPLMLSFDMTNATTMDAVWPFVTNVEAIAVNQAWAGHPGLMVNATRCANATASGGGGGGGSGGVDVEIWVKPMLAAKKNGKKQGKRLALFVVSQERPGPGWRDSPSSAVAVDIDVDIDVAALAAALALPVPGATALRDVWAHADVAGGVIGGVVKVRNLAPHDSAFYIIG